MGLFAEFKNDEAFKFAKENVKVSQMLLQLPATWIVIFLCVLGLVSSRPVATFIPFLIANSVTGFFYMISEASALEHKGSKLFGTTYKLGRCRNILANIASHVVVPGLILRYTKGPGKPNIMVVLVLELLGLGVLDIKNVYPGNIHVYVCLHVLCVLSTASMI